MTLPGDSSRTPQRDERGRGTEMTGDISNKDATDNLIDVARWLIAENAHHANHIHVGMRRKQMELVAQLHDAREHNERLSTANTALEERVAALTEAYATLVGDAFDLAELKQHLPMPFQAGDARWCAQAAAAMCRSTPID